MNRAALREDAACPAGLTEQLGTTQDGLTNVEAAQRLSVQGPNELTTRTGHRWIRELAGQFTQPLAMLLTLAAVLAWIGDTPALSIAIVLVIAINAGFAFLQQRQAERAVDVLAALLPPTAVVVRQGERVTVDARELVVGDLLVVVEGAKVCADAQILDGSVHLDMSAMTGESLPVLRTGKAVPGSSVIDATNLVLSGTSCLAGEATAVITHTGMNTQLGLIAALSQDGTPPLGPLEKQVRRATWIIAGVAVGFGAVFLPVGLVAGLAWGAAISFSIGMIVANVPEGLLPTITLALAAGVRELAGKGAVVKRLSAVETLGSTTVICTDKTGTLTENRMTVVAAWLPGATYDVLHAPDSERARALAVAAAACTTARAGSDTAEGSGDPTERALLDLARSLGVAVPAARRDSGRVTIHDFDAALERMATIDMSGRDRVIHVKGALESVLPTCSSVLDHESLDRPMTPGMQDAITDAATRYAVQGLRVLAIARRSLGAAAPLPTARAETECDLQFLGLLALMDPPRPGVKEAVAVAHRAGIAIHVITGDFGPTAAQIARQVGIGTGSGGSRIVTGPQMQAWTDVELAAALRSGQEMVFSRITPEGKLRICTSLQDAGHVVAMTGDGVNDAPALRHADIGVAMGKSGTDVAREAATMVLTDDHFSTIVAAVSTGRQVYDNVRKFMLYIFAHAVPEVVPFLIFALSGGAVPLPLTVLQILAIDLGTETLPALALGRERAEPGLMDRPPRRRTAGIIDRKLLLRSWVLLGGVSAALVVGAFFLTLQRGGWDAHAETGPGAPLNHLYLQATTMTFVGIVACQIGVAFAARTERASLRQIGIWSNPLLLWGIAFEIAFTAAVVYLPVLQDIFGTAALRWDQLWVVVPFPVIVWGVDEVARWVSRSRHTASANVAGSVPVGPGIRGFTEAAGRPPL